MILLELAHLSADLEEHEETYQLAEKAYDYFRSSNNRLRLAWAQLYCADSAFHMKKWEDSLSSGRDALRLFAEEEDLVGQGWTCANLCRTHNEEGHFEEALVYGRMGVDVFTEKGDREGLGVCQYFQAYSQMGMNNLVAAQELFLSGLDHLVARNIHWRIDDILFGLAQLKVKQGERPFGFMIASVLAQDENIHKDLKTKVADLLSGVQPLLNRTEIKEVREKLSGLTVEKLAEKLMDKAQVEFKFL